VTIYDDVRAKLAEAEAGYQQLTADLNAAEQQIMTLTQQLEECQAAQQPETPTTPTQPQPTGTKIGCSWKGTEGLPASITKIDSYRYFFQPGDMKSAKTWGGNARTAHDKYGCRNFSVSFKPDSASANPPFAAASITNMTNYLKSIPSDVPRENVYVTFYHEHDGNIRDGSYSLDLYKKGSKQVADVAHSLGMKYGPIHNGWPMKISEWQSKEADVSLYDFWCADCYSDTYQASSPYMDVLKQYADSLKKPLLIGEMASPAESGSKQEDWCKQARTWALKNTAVAHYWSSQVGTTGTNYRLSDQAARNWFGV